MYNFFDKPIFPWDDPLKPVKALQSKLADCACKAIEKLVTLRYLPLKFYNLTVWDQPDRSKMFEGSQKYLSNQNDPNILALNLAFDVLIGVDPSPCFHSGDFRIYRTIGSIFYDGYLQTDDDKWWPNGPENGAALPTEELAVLRMANVIMRGFKEYASLQTKPDAPIYASPFLKLTEQQIIEDIPKRKLREGIDYKANAMLNIATIILSGNRRMNVPLDMLHEIMGQTDE